MRVADIAWSPTQPEVAFQEQWPEGKDIVVVAKLDATSKPRKFSKFSIGGYNTSGVLRLAKNDQPYALEVGGNKPHAGVPSDEEDGEVEAAEASAAEAGKPTRRYRADGTKIR